MFIGAGQDAKLRANRERIQNEWGTTWSLDWNERFVSAEEISSDQDVLKEYQNLTIQFAKEIGGRTTSVFQQR